VEVSLQKFPFIQNPKDTIFPFKIYIVNENLYFIYFKFININDIHECVSIKMIFMNEIISFNLN
jgi:hypothetical protein